MIDDLERDLIGGRARWMAELNEFFREYTVGDVSFNLVARGRTRSRGFFLSRFFSSTVLPDYSVSLFCVDETSGPTLTAEKLHKKMDAVLHFIQEEGEKWAWLVVFSGRELPPSVVAYASRYDRRELGLAVASTTSGQIIVSNNQIGRSIKKQLKLPKVLERFQRAKTE